MKLPFVSRDTLDLSVRAAAFARDTADRLTQQCAELTAQLAAQNAELRAANTALLDRLLPTIPVPHAPPDIAPRKLPSVISQTIRDESGGDVRLAGHFRKRARDLKLEHPDWTPEQIAEQLRQWQTTATEGVA